MTETRARIVDYVETHPGVHFNALTRALDLAPGQVQYHVRDLRDEATLVADGYYGRTHYFPPQFDDWERGALALARRETARDVLVHLLEAGPSRPAATADSVGVARSTLEHHLDHLVECGVVEKERDAHNRVTLELTRPESTVRLLETVRPAASERFVARFERLVDSLLD